MLRRIAIGQRESLNDVMPFAIGLYGINRNSQLIRNGFITIIQSPKFYDFLSLLIGHFASLLSIPSRIIFAFSSWVGFGSTICT